ncbi:transcriptional regulator [Mycobacterium alsense]|uniref:ATP-binding protein n=1 Tax=Mycobacterium alsense TaxID=324058 RepID=A0AA41XJE0_9MYCO|nr:ATP-binding protein [Mycobacterium alsense]OQZ93021.1 transcriptional regulator [Mycobacterium alsense]
MSFTELHRALGVAPGPLTDELLNDAVAAGVAETDGLDWKSELPPAKGLSQTDFPKDVAAMANSGGGVIVYGIRETQKAATERLDVGEVDEAYERSLRSAAITAITPPVFGLNVLRLGAEGNRAVVVEVPASVDGPHLTYKNEYFAAPVRNDSDTVWMKERQIEAMYRARFDERRHAKEALDTLLSEAAAGRDTDTRSWLIAVARPRIPRFKDRLSREAAREVLSKAEHLALTYAGRGGIHPLESVDRLNPRPGLRRWVAVNTATGDSSIWKESWASIHDDGSVTLATAVGGHRTRDGYFEGWEVESSAIECAIADVMALIRTTAEATGNDEYDVRLGIAWSGGNPLMILTKDTQGYTYDGVSTPLHHYTPVETTVNAIEPALDYFWHVHDLAQDCVNQGGISNVLMICPPDRDNRE